jgi:hypothetical protein
MRITRLNVHVMDVTSDGRGSSVSFGITTDHKITQKHRRARG